MGKALSSKSDFIEINMSHKGMFDEFMSTISEPVTETSFAVIYLWREPLQIRWAILHEHLCVLSGGNYMSLLIPPLPGRDAGPGDFVKATRASFEVMDAYNAAHADRSRSCIDYMPTEFEARCQELLENGMITQVESYDYVYKTSRIIQLSGNDLQSKRHARGKFMRTFPDHRTEPYADCYRDECLELLDRWYEARSQQVETSTGQRVPDYCMRLLGNEKEFTRAALASWQELGLSGLVLLVEDKVIGFTFGESLTKSQASILIEKTHGEYPGAPTFIFSEFCRQFWAGHAECNVGDDGGTPGLKFSKESYRPARLLPKLAMRRRAS